MKLELTDNQITAQLLLVDGHSYNDPFGAWIESKFGTRPDIPLFSFVYEGTQLLENAFGKFDSNELVRFLRNTVIGGSNFSDKKLSLPSKKLSTVLKYASNILLQHAHFKKTKQVSCTIRIEFSKEQNQFLLRMHDFKFGEENNKSVA